ncbi:MAG: hypothetical protein IPL26_13535 [Leptospiraceae bacterium]|nr:hypothetical protein [Leptospiraceae bacterium]
MSTYDELFGAYGSGFQSLKIHIVLLFSEQIDWVKFLINFCHKANGSSYNFRVHPRDFPNKRDSGMSEQALLLSDVFKLLPDNCSVNYPSDNISLYDIMEEVDVFLNGHSTTGVEMTFFGYPVVLYDPHIVHYPPDLNFFDPDITAEGYIKKIDEALNTGWSFENIRKAYRWLDLWHNKISVDMADALPFYDYIGSSSFSFKIFNFLSRHLFKSFGKKFRIYTRPNRLKNTERILDFFDKGHENLAFNFQQSPETLEKETGYIKKNFEYLYEIFYGNDRNAKKDSLHFRLKEILGYK